MRRVWRGDIEVNAHDHLAEFFKTRAYGANPAFDFKLGESPFFFCRGNVNMSC